MRARPRRAHGPHHIDGSSDGNREGLGDTWGIYLVSGAGFEAVRRHLQQFLMVEADGEENRLFFPLLRSAGSADLLRGNIPEQRSEIMMSIDVILYEVQGHLACLNPVETVIRQ